MKLFYERHELPKGFNGPVYYQQVPLDHETFKGTQLGSITKMKEVKYLRHKYIIYNKQRELWILEGCKTQVEILFGIVEEYVYFVDNISNEIGELKVLLKTDTEYVCFDKMDRLFKYKINSVLNREQYEIKLEELKFKAKDDLSKLVETFKLTRDDVLKLYEEIHK